MGLRSGWGPGPAVVTCIPSVPSFALPTWCPITPTSLRSTVFSQIAQLRHEVSMRDDLLHIYTNTTEECEPVSVASMP